MYQTTVGVDGMMCGMCEAHVNGPQGFSGEEGHLLPWQGSDRHPLRAGARRTGGARRH